MKKYTKTFVNPLLAMAFIDGVNWLNDPDIICEPPRRDGVTKWVVNIIDEDDDEDDEEPSESNGNNTISVEPTSAKPAVAALSAAIESSIKSKKSEKQIIAEPLGWEERSKADHDRVAARLQSQNSVVTPVDARKTPNDMMVIGQAPILVVSQPRTQNIEHDSSDRAGESRLNHVVPRQSMMQVLEEYADPADDEEGEPNRKKKWPCNQCLNCATNREACIEEVNYYSQLNLR